MFWIINELQNSTKLKFLNEEILTDLCKKLGLPEKTTKEQLEEEIEQLKKESEQSVEKIVQLEEEIAQLENKREQLNEKNEQKTVQLNEKNEQKYIQLKEEIEQLKKELEQLVNSKSIKLARFRSADCEISSQSANRVVESQKHTRRAPPGGF